MLQIEIDNNKYLDFNSFEVEESLCFPFHIKLALTPTQETPLADSLVHEGVIITYHPTEGDKERFSWIEPLTAYYGYVAQEERQYDLHNNLAAVWLEIFHPLYLLEGTAQFRIFYQKKLADILAEVFEPYRAAFGKYKVSLPACSPDISEISPHYCTQYQETDLHFFLRLCETYGIRMIAHDQTVQIQGSPLRPPGKSYAVPAEARIYWRRFSSFLGRTLKHRNIKCTKSLKDVVTKSDDVAGTAASSPPSPYWVDIFEPDVKEAERKLAVQHQYLAHAESRVEIQNRQLENNFPLAGVRAGQLVTIPTVEKEIYIYQVHCTIGGSVAGAQGAVRKPRNYNLSLQGREKEHPYTMPPRHEKPQVQGFLRARVVDPIVPSSGDKDRLGRIKVQFLWQESKSPTCWVRLAMPYAGKTHGLYVMPEIGDEVLVAFEGGDIDRPLCLGSVYNGDAKVLQSLDEAQQMQTILLRTPENIRLKFVEVPGQTQEATLAVQDISVMVMDNGAKITISVHGKRSSTITLHEGDVTVESQDTITVKSKEVNVLGDAQIVLRGGKIKLN